MKPAFILKSVLSLGIMFTFLLPLAKAEVDDDMVNDNPAVSQLADEYAKMGGATGATDRAKTQVRSLLESMEAQQYDYKSTFDSLSDTVRSLPALSEKRKEAMKLLEENEFNLKTATERFLDLDIGEHVSVVRSIAGTLPYVEPDQEYSMYLGQVTDLTLQLRALMITPNKPGPVPEGDLVTDFLPQIIRQLFRFAWVAVFIAFTVSGVLFVVAQDNDERLTQAKGILYYTLLGFAFIALAFAIVKAVTDIDFFRFI